MNLWPFNSPKSTHSIKVDFHSHLIPGVDDGVHHVEDTLTILKSFSELGYRKVITTPHIYPEVYPNTEEDLSHRYQKVLSEIDLANIEIEFELAAEYFLHGELLKKVQSKKRLLSFGESSFLLFETGFQQKPLVWDEIIFELQVQGYRPVLAHPERYAYVSEDLDLVQKWRDQGLKMQLNISSVLGLYGKNVQKTARELIRRKQVDFLCSDLHRLDQLNVFKQAQKNKLFQDAALLVQNNNLL